MATAARVVVAAILAVAARLGAARGPILGCGWIYGGWKYPNNTSAQHAWDAASTTMLRAMGAQASGGSINWCDVEATQGVYNWTHGRSKQTNK